MKPITDEKISVWKGTCEDIDFPQLSQDIEVDVAIIGGGITGVTAAHLLSSQGKKVALLEAWKIGESSTGYSTGNLYSVVDERLHVVKTKFDKETVRKVTESRSSAIDHIESIIRQYNIDCDFSRNPWYLFMERDAKA